MPEVAGHCDLRDARLYYEATGSGPVLLFIAGASGDGGWFEPTARRLADSYRVVTYDRRNHSRSPRVAGWERTSVDQQADDAAALLRFLGVESALVFGTSSGATIAMNLALRHRALVRASVLHEPPKIGILPQRDRLRDELRQKMALAVKTGGYERAMADFMAWLSDVPRSADDRATIARTLRNGEVWIRAELGVVDRYDPPPQWLAEGPLRTTVVVGRQGGTALHEQLRATYAAALERLADRLGGRLAEMSGAHVPYCTDAAAFAAELDAVLRAMR